MPLEERGTASALWAAGAIIGYGPYFPGRDLSCSLTNFIIIRPVIGPVIGGFVTQAGGWRWTFWVISIAAGAVAGPCLIFLRETYSVAILQRKTERLRKQTGNASLRSMLDTDGVRDPQKAFLESVKRPFFMFFTSLVVSLLGLYSAVSLSFVFILLTTFSNVFIERYGFGYGVSGLTTLGQGIGMVLGQGFYSVLTDRAVRKHTAKGDYRPKHRLPPMLVGSITAPVGLFWYGWTV